MRRAAESFQAADSDVLVVGPERPERFQSYWADHAIPFRGLPDPHHTVLERYGQEVSLFKLGRMPAQVLIDREGIVRYAHYGSAMSDIPEPEEILSLIADIDGDGSAT